MAEDEDEVKVEVVDATVIPVLLSGELVPRKEIDPEALVEALRYLQKLIPDAVHLTLREKQSMANAANLDPSIIESGTLLGAAWESLKRVLGTTPEEIRAELDKTRRWDEVDRVLLALRETVHSTNLQRKHRIGTLILNIYAIVGDSLRRRRVSAAYEHLRPYYEQMKAAILGVRKKKSRKKTTPEE